MSRFDSSSSSTSGADRNALDLDAAVGVEGERGDAAVGGDELVLLADRLLQRVDLEMAGLLGQLLAGHELAACRCGAR